jgi:ABC-type uncharacterized transport system substrate-binding protein
VLEIRSADGALERLPRLAAELVSVKVDVLVAASNLAIAPAYRATTSIPIVMTNAIDPVTSGFIETLAHPGGNVTGLTIQSPDVVGKPLQLLKQAVADLPRVAVLWDPDPPDARQTVRKVEAVARSLGVRLQLVEVRSRGELEDAFAAATRENARGVVLLGSPLQYAARARIAELALRRRLPTACTLRDLVEAGCLIGYGANPADQYRRAAAIVDKILKGARPGDLPIEQPTKFDSVINMKTARALGLTIPPSLLRRLDQVVP